MSHSEYVAKYERLVKRFHKAGVPHIARVHWRLQPHQVKRHGRVQLRAMREDLKRL